MSALRKLGTPVSPLHSQLAGLSPKVRIYDWTHGRNGRMGVFLRG